MSSRSDGQLLQQLQQLQKELAQKEVALGQQDSLCKDQANKIEELVKQMAEMEDHLNHSYNQTLESLYAGMMQAKEEKEELMEQMAELESQVEAAKEEQERILQQPATAAEDSEELLSLREMLADVEKRLEESNHQLRFLQGSAQKAQDEKRHHEDRALTLQAEMLKLNGMLKEKENALAMAEMRAQKEAQMAASVRSIQSTPPVVEAPVSVSNTSDELRTRIAELESRLGVSNRVADFLQKSLQKAEEQSHLFKDQKSQMSAELDTIKRQLLENVAKLEESNEKTDKQERQIQEMVKKLEDAEKSLNSTQQDREAKVQEAVESANSGQKELLHKISQLEFRLIESRRFAEFVQSSLNKLKIEKETNEAKSNATIANLEFKLKEGSRVSQFVQQTLERKTNEFKQLELSSMGEKKQLEFKVAEASRMTVFLQNKLQEMEKKSSAEIANLQFKLTEATRMTQFLTTNANKIGENMRKQRDEMETLEKQLEATRGELAAAKSASKAKDGILAAHSETVTELRRKVGEIESRLSVSNRVCDFLQTNLSKAEEMKNMAEMRRDDVEKQLSVLTNQLSETESKMKALSQLSEVQARQIETLMNEMADTTNSLTLTHKSALAQLNIALETKEQEAKNLAAKVAQLEFCVTESQRLSTFVQSKMKSLENEKNEQAEKYEAEKAQLKFKATESSRMAVFAQGAFTKAGEEKKAIEAKIAGEKAKLEFNLAEATRMTTFLTNKVKDTEKTFQGRLKDLEFKVTESNRVSKYQQTSLARLAEEKQCLASEKNQLEFQVEQLKQKLEEKELELSARDSYASDFKKRISDLQMRMAMTEGKLAVAYRMNDFLTKSLSQAEEEKAMLQSGH
jgi:chromosome segregation ATPase